MKPKSRSLMLKTKNAVIYARYSSHNQRDVSIDQQVKAVRSFAAVQGLTVTGVYADRAISGTTDQRPEFQRMIEDAKAGLFSYVLVYSLDRFARDRFDSVTYKQILKEHGVRVLSAMENIGDDAAGVLMEAVLEGLAEYYSRELSTKIKRGLQDNAEKCLVACALPYGYRKGADGKFEIDPAEADVVREVFRRVAAHETLADIYRDLNARGIRTKHGAEWNRSSFRKMLANERYIGTYIYGDIRIEGGVPAIVDRSTFYAVREEMERRSEPQGEGVPAKRRGRNVYYLTGKLFCGLCESALVGTSGRGKSGTSYTYYACKKQLKEKTCTKTAVSQPKIEWAIAKAIREFAMDDELIEELVESSLEKQDEMAKEQDRELDTIRDELKQTETAVSNIMKAIEQGIITPDMKARMEELSAKKAHLKAMITAGQKRNRIEMLTREEFEAAFQLVREGEIDNKVFQELLFDMFLRKAIVFEDHILIVFAYEKNGHDTVDLPFDPDSIPDVPCSYKRMWWTSGDHIRNAKICVIDGYILIYLPYVA